MFRSIDGSPKPLSAEAMCSYFLNLCIDSNPAGG